MWICLYKKYKQLLLTSLLPLLKACASVLVFISIKSRLLNRLRKFFMYYTLLLRVAFFLHVLFFIFFCVSHSALSVWFSTLPLKCVFYPYLAVLACKHACTLGSLYFHSSFFLSLQFSQFYHFSTFPIHVVTFDWNIVLPSSHL